jgi:succinyl-CoA:acetate CoA-transferase
LLNHGFVSLCLLAVSTGKYFVISACILATLPWWLISAVSSFHPLSGERWMLTFLSYESNFVGFFQESASGFSLVNYAWRPLCVVVQSGFAPVKVQLFNYKNTIPLQEGWQDETHYMQTSFSTASPADRVLCPVLRERIMTADQAAGLIQSGMTLGMSGFTPAGAPKAVPQALARRIEAERQWRKLPHQSVDGSFDLARARWRTGQGAWHRTPSALPVGPHGAQGDQRGRMQYVDIHLSHVAQHVWFGFLGHLDVAVIEVAGILPDGRLIPSTSVGNNKTWLEQADKIILEVNSAQPAELEGMHDIYYGRPCRQAQAHTHGASVRPHWRALSALRSEQGDCRGANGSVTGWQRSRTR